jgi:ferrochelatase
MRRYLKEFLSDRRVIETNRVLWWAVLNGIVLTTRPKRSGHAYDKIWNRERNESPLKTITRGQSEKLAQRLASDARIEVDWAMRYGLPPVLERIRALQEKGCDRLLVFPLYPQYCAATTATALDKTFEALESLRWMPSLRSVPPYYGHPAYIQALAESVRTHLAGLSFAPDVILASFHGLPEAYILKGDPYNWHCQETARRLREALGLPTDKLLVTFQSRFGRAKWLEPYTAETVEGLAKKRVKNIAVITPGFAADCVETLEEIAIGVAETFKEAGGENFTVIPCLNDSTPSIAMLETIVREELAGWA